MYLTTTFPSISIPSQHGGPLKKKSVISITNPAIDTTKHRKGIGLVPYNTKTRNDIRVAFCFLATKMKTPSQLDYEALKHLTAYLWSTREIGLCFHPASSVNGNTDTILLSATDGSWDPQLEDSSSVLGTLHKIGAIDDHSAPIAASTNNERGACSMRATVCAAKALLEGIERVIVHRGIAADLGRPQDLPTIMIQDNSGVMATLTHVTPKAGMKGERRMRSHLKGRIAELAFKMQQNGTKEQPADPLTKTVMQNLCSLPTLQDNNHRSTPLRTPRRTQAYKTPFPHSSHSRSSHIFRRFPSTTLSSA